jgi:hypothetical protein
MEKLFNLAPNDGNGDFSTTDDYFFFHVYKR